MIAKIAGSNRHGDSIIDVLIAPKRSWEQPNGERE
jgi:hypothetical protein